MSLRAQGRNVVVLAVLAAVVGALTAIGILPGWLGTATIVVLVLIAAIGLWGMANSRDQKVILRLDEEGVWVCGELSARWPDLREIAIAPLKPTWFLSRLMVVAFLPRPGVELHDPRRSPGRLSTFGRRAGERWYGTRLVFIPSTMTATADQIADSAELFGGIPIRRTPNRFMRHVVMLLGLAAAAGVISGLVSVLVERSG